MSNQSRPAPLYSPTYGDQVYPPLALTAYAHRSGLPRDPDVNCNSCLVHMFFVHQYCLDVDDDGIQSCDSESTPTYVWTKPTVIKFM